MECHGYLLFIKLSSQIKLCTHYLAAEIFSYLIIKASLIQFSPFSSTVSTCQNLTRKKKLKRIGGGRRHTRIPVYITSFSEITTVNLGFPLLWTKPSGSKYSSLTPSLPLNYIHISVVNYRTTAETPTNWLAIHLGSHALQQLPTAELRDSTRYNATESDMQGTHCFREGGKRDREKCAHHQPRDQGVAGEGGI